MRTLQPTIIKNLVGKHTTWKPTFSLLASALLPPCKSIISYMVLPHILYLSASSSLQVWWPRLRICVEPSNDGVVAQGWLVHIILIWFRSSSLGLNLKFNSKIWREPKLHHFQAHIRSKVLTFNPPKTLLSKQVEARAMCAWLYHVTSTNTGATIKWNYVLKRFEPTKVQ